MFFVGDEFQSIYGFRHADVAVFRERRESAGGGLPLVQNYRLGPEVLEAVNYLFRGDFGEGFQNLTASGEFPDPVPGHPVELLVTDKSTYWNRHALAPSGRRGTSRAGVRELIESGAATAGDIVLLAAGTDAEWYEQELRALGIPTYRATGRGYFGQQQVVDLQLREAPSERVRRPGTVSVLASPFVGVSNDSLFLLRRPQGGASIFTGLERSYPRSSTTTSGCSVRSSSDTSDSRPLLQARRAALRADPRRARLRPRGAGALGRPPSVREPPQAGAAGTRLRGARGRDIEGFLRFMRDQEAVGAKEPEAVAGGGGRGRGPAADDSRRQGARVQRGDRCGRRTRPAAAGAGRASRCQTAASGSGVADPITSRRARRLRVRRGPEGARGRVTARSGCAFYYVAMTRAIDRLIVLGAVDPSSTADASTPSGGRWRD